MGHAKINTTFGHKAIISKLDGSPIEEKPVRKLLALCHWDESVFHLNRDEPTKIVMTLVKVPSDSDEHFLRKVDDVVFSLQRIGLHLRSDKKSLREMHEYSNE